VSVARIFISHSSSDKPFAKRLGSDLISAGHDVFLDEWVIAAGACIPTAIATGLDQCDVLVLVLSSRAVNSRWVNEEWKTAYWEQVSGGKKRVVPLLLESCEIPLLLRKVRYADFRTDYDRALADLVDSLTLKDSVFLGPESTAAEENDSLSEWPSLFPEAAQLADFMSDLSEWSNYHASWLIGLEYILWDALVSGPRASGNFPVTARQISVLKSLSAACGGWIAYTQRGQIWVPMEEWKQHFSDPTLYSLEDRFFAESRSSIRKRQLYAFLDWDSTRSPKQEALLFDKIAVPGFGAALDSPGKIDKNARELLSLVKQGIVIPSIPTSTVYTRGGAEEALAKQIEKYSWSSHERRVLYARLTALQFQRIHGVDAYALYDSVKYPSSGVDKARERAIRVVFSKIPVPLEDVSWDRIVAYRKDPDSLRRFSALRVWISNVARRKLSESEALELLDSLVADFEAHLRMYKMRCRHKPLGIVVSCDEDRAGELASSRPGRNGHYERAGDVTGLRLLKAELASPGREVA
jgi:hypothetical protein